MTTIIYLALAAALVYTLLFFGCKGWKAPLIPLARFSLHLRSLTGTDYLDEDAYFIFGAFVGALVCGGLRILPILAITVILARLWGSWVTAPAAK